MNFLSSIPFDEDDKNKIFKKHRTQNKFEILPKELSLALNLQQIREGGFFIMIGKKSNNQ